jgi:PhnB protein
MATVNPYLHFAGNCEEVFEFYKSIFGGEFLTLMRFKEAPPEVNFPESEGEKILHIALTIGQGTVLMGSDLPAAMGPTTVGDNFSISINAGSNAEATELFEGLSAGGQVTMPLGKVFWGGEFGMCADKFGIQWMVSYGESQQE